MTMWREVKEHTGMETGEHGPHHEVFKEERCPKSMMTGLEDEKTTLHVEGLYPNIEREYMRPSEK
jgi:hypothetical protein